MKTKSQQIVDLLKDGQWHTQQELNAICFRYGARIKELNELLVSKGKEIVNRRIKGSEFHYRMQPQGYDLDQPVVTQDTVVRRVNDVFGRVAPPVDSVRATQQSHDDIIRRPNYQEMVEKGRRLIEESRRGNAYRTQLS
jgi:rRNA processing protein Gar1